MNSRITGASTAGVLVLLYRLADLIGLQRWRRLSGILAGHVRGRLRHRGEQTISETAAQGWKTEGSVPGLSHHPPPCRPSRHGVRGDAAQHNPYACVPHPTTGPERRIASSGRRPPTMVREGSPQFQSSLDGLPHRPVTRPALLLGNRTASSDCQPSAHDRFPDAAGTGWFRSGQDKPDHRNYTPAVQRHAASPSPGAQKELPLSPIPARAAHAATASNTSMPALPRSQVEEFNRRASKKSIP